jgi:hypothetical protein
MSMTLEPDGADVRSMSHRLRKRPVVLSGSSRHKGEKLIGGDDGALGERAVGGDIGLIERQGGVGQHHIPGDGIMCEQVGECGLVKQDRRRDQKADLLSERRGVR